MTFDDKKLAALVEASPVKDKPEEILHIMRCAIGSSITNSERQTLLAWLYENRYAGHNTTSMSQMRREILQKIGAKVSGSSEYRNTVNAAELRAIYNFVVKGIKP